MRRLTFGPLQWYLGGVCVGGVFVLVRVVDGVRVEDVVAASPALWMFAGLVLIGELWPIKVRRREEGGEVTTSSTFAFALLLAFGTGAAVLSQAVGSVAADVARRKSWWRTAFNASQYAISLAAGGAVLRELGAPAVFGAAAPLAPADIVPLLLAGTVMFLLQNIMTAIAIALDAGGSLYGALRRDFAFNLSTAGVLLALSPVLVVVADRSLPLIPLLLLMVAALNKSARVTLEKQHEALHDLLTDLPNRRMFLDRMADTLSEGKRAGTQVAVMLVDLDRFKEINDTLGHHIGDQVLQQIGPRLRHTVREIDTIARLGGDEFAILLTTVEGPEAAMRIARRVVAGLDRPLVIQGFPLEVKASVGVAVYPSHGETVEVLMQRADVAMYAAKRGRLGAALYSNERDGRSRGRLDLLSQLSLAIHRDELTVHYQPKADIATGRIRGVEALVRWQHPDLGLVPPDDFVPLAEHTELIGPLTSWVLDRALAQCAAWHAEGLLLSVAVNLSVYSLYDVAFPTEVARLLANHGLDASWLELEITENTLMADPPRARSVLAELSSMGVCLAIDDFGTGYSSLGHLKHLPVSEIKIDKSFVLAMPTDDDDAVIVRSIIDLAGNLGLRVVAEGVESQQVWQQLADLGCHHAQGYHLCRPTAAPALTEWLREACIDAAAPAEGAGGAPAPRLVLVANGDDTARNRRPRAG